MGKESFIIYKSFYKPISKLSDKQLGRLFRAIFEYNINGVVSVEEDIEMAFEFFKNQFDLDNEKYQSKVERNRDNARRGGIAKANAKKTSETSESGGMCQTQATATKRKRPLAMAAYNDNDNDNENDKSNSARARIRAHEIGDLTFISDEYRDVFAKWIAYKTERKEKYKTQGSLRECYERLKTLSGNNPGTAMAIVNQSMANNWAGLFELKQSKNGNSSQQDRKSFESSSEISFKRKADIEI